MPVLADPAGRLRAGTAPDAWWTRFWRRNLGTHITDAPIVIAVGPGFTAGVDCHAAVETMRGHTLGRVLYTGSPLPNTGVPGVIGGHAAERVLRAPQTACSSRAMKLAIWSRRETPLRTLRENP